MIHIIQASWFLASSINKCLLWQQRNSKILSKWSDSSRRPTCPCDTLVCGWFHLWHNENIWHQSYRHNSQLLVRCWCNKQASQICAFIPWRQWQEAIYCCGFCWSIISWIWVLFGCFRRNPLWIHKPSAKDCSHIGCSPEPRDILLWEKEEVRPELSGCVRCPGQISGHIYLVAIRDPLLITLLLKECPCSTNWSRAF